jgi:hypothetical protein
MTKTKTKPQPDKTVEIIIQPVKHMQGDFIAFYKSDMLSCTFSVYFKDTIMGALALNSFYEMLAHTYPGKIDFCVENYEREFKNKALLDVLSSNA